DAVPGHRDLPSLRTQARDDLGLAIREDARDDLVDAEARGDRLRRRRVVAGHHDEMHAVLAKKRKRLARRRLDRIGDTEEPHDGRAVHEIHHGLPLGTQRLGARIEVAGLEPERLEQRAVADRRSRAADDSDDACARQRLEILDRLERDAALARGFDDRARERMLAAGFEARGNREHSGFVERAGRDDRDATRPAFGIRSGLVTDEGVYTAVPTMSSGGPYQHTYSRDT